MSAALIIIGNEILSGRTQDANIHYLAGRLCTVGYPLEEVRIIPDIEEVIIKTVNELRQRYAFVFTTGGIGPTHDDITALSIAKAFGVDLITHPDAWDLLLAHYGKDHFIPARQRMAQVPSGATLIANPASAAPGFKMENVFVLAGVPSIMKAMAEEIFPIYMTDGTPSFSKTLRCFVAESLVADDLRQIQDQFPDVMIGSYPFFKGGQIGTCLVGRSTDEDRLTVAMKAIHSAASRLDCVIEQEAAP